MAVEPAPVPPPPPPRPDLPTVGVHFVPSKVLLLEHFLQNRVNGVSSNPHVPDIDVYAMHPSRVFEKATKGRMEDDEPDNGKMKEHRFCFTPLTKLAGHGNGKRARRTVKGLGTWRGDNTKYVNDTNAQGVKRRIGFDTYLKFVPHSEKNDEYCKGHAVQEGEREVRVLVEWLMHEFTLLNRSDIAVCRITRRESRYLVVGRGMKRSPSECCMVDDNYDQDLMINRKNVSPSSCIMTHVSGGETRAFDVNQLPIPTSATFNDESPLVPQQGNIAQCGIDLGKLVDDLSTIDFEEIHQICEALETGDDDHDVISLDDIPEDECGRK